MPRYSDNLVSVDQFDTGLIFNFERLAQEAKYERLYNENYDDLFSIVPSVANGLRFFPDTRDIIKVPLFKYASVFYQKAVMAEPPQLSTESIPAQEWWAEYEDEIVRVLKAAIEYWSYKGRLVIFVTEAGDYFPVDPSDYFRIGRVTDPDHAVAHVVAYRWHESTPVELMNPHNKLLPNRITIYKYVPKTGVSTVNTYLFSPSKINGTVGARYRIGSEIQDVGRSPIADILVVGNGDSWYGEVSDVAARYMIEITNLIRELNKYSNRPKAFPADSFANEIGSEVMTLQERVDRMRNLVDPIVSYTAGNSNRSSAPRFDDTPIIQDHLNTLNYLSELFRQGAEIPVQAWREALSRAPSGYAIEKSEDSAAITVRDIRRGVGNKLVHLFIAGGAPLTTKDKLEWLNDPFENQYAKADLISQDLSDGIIDSDEARALRGYKPRTAAQRREHEQDQEQGMMSRMMSGIRGMLPGGNNNNNNMEEDDGSDPDNESDTPNPRESEGAARGRR